MDPNWNDLSAWNMGPPNQGYPGGAPGYPPGGPGYPAGGPGYPAGGPGYPAGGPGQPGPAYGGYPQGGAPNPGFGQGHPGSQPGYAAGPPTGYPGGQPQGYGGGQAQGYGGGQPQGYGGGQAQGYGGGQPQGYGGGQPQGYGGGQAQGYPGAAPGFGGGYPAGASSQKSGDVCEPSLRPCPNFNAEEDCKRLRKAMKGLGTDEKAIIEIMSRRTSTQRVEIKNKFKTMYGKDLISEFKSELTGHFEQLVVAMCYKLRELDARELRDAMEGAGTNEDTLIEILCSRSNAEINEIKQIYSKMYQGRNLEKDLIDETSGHFKRLLISQVQGNRDESLAVNQQAAQQDAQALYSAGEKQLGTDESTFNMILCSKSFAHLRAVFKCYEQISKNSIEKALKSEMHGTILESFLAVVRCASNKPKFFAKELHDAMRGAGTRDTKLIRIVVSRAEVDMNAIKREFQAEHGKPLANHIKSDTSGDYEKMLLALVGQ